MVYCEEGVVSSLEDGKHFNYVDKFKLLDELKRVLLKKNGFQKQDSLSM